MDDQTKRQIGDKLTAYAEGELAADDFITWVDEAEAANEGNPAAELLHRFTVTLAGYASGHINAGETRERLLLEAKNAGIPVAVSA